jgi:hypothetical protein
VGNGGGAVLRGRRRGRQGPLRDPVTGERTPLRYAKVSRWPPRRLKDVIYRLGLPWEEQEFLFRLYMNIMIEDRWPTLEELCPDSRWPAEWVDAEIASLVERGLMGRRRDGAVYPLDFPRLIDAAQRLRKRSAAAK